MRCWLHPEQKCSSECAARFTLSSREIESGKVIASNYYPLMVIKGDVKVEVLTPCTLIAALWRIGDKEKRYGEEKPKTVKREKKKEPKPAVAGELD
jgi:hypothetical protein